MEPEAEVGRGKDGRTWRIARDPEVAAVPRR
jgi:hypothetical protein